MDYHDCPLGHLLLTAGAVMDVEAKSRRDFDEFFFMHRGSFTPAVMFLWAALRHEDGKFTIEQATERLQDFLSSGSDMGEVWKCLDRAAIAGGIVKAVDPGNPKTAESDTAE